MEEIRAAGLAVGLSEADLTKMGEQLERTRAENAKRKAKRKAQEKARRANRG